MNGRIAGLGIALVSLGGCHPTTTTTAARTPVGAPLASQPVAGFDRADLVAFDDGRAVLYALADDGIKEVGRVDIGHSGVDQAGWAGRDAFYVNGADREVLRVTAAGVAVVPVPPVADITLPEPPYDAYLSEVRWEELAVDDTGAWYGVCPYGVGGDDGHCNRWVWLALDGSGRREEGGDRGRTWTMPEEAPPGYLVIPHTVDGRTDSVVCTSPNGTTTRLDGGYGWDVIGQRWISADPPALMVMSGYKTGANGDIDRVMHWELHDGCGTVRAMGATFEAGPGGLWLGFPSDSPWDGQPILFRGADRLGELRSGHVIRFRPPA